MHTVTVLDKNTGKVVYKKKHLELVRAVVDYNSQKRLKSEVEYGVELKSNLIK